MKPSAIAGLLTLKITKKTTFDFSHAKKRKKTDKFPQLC